jgi:hypothetical protein
MHCLTYVVVYIDSYTLFKIINLFLIEKSLFIYGQDAGICSYLYICIYAYVYMYMYICMYTDSNM